jgi:hypothetical protein
VAGGSFALLVVGGVIGSVGGSGAGNAGFIPLIDRGCLACRIDAEAGETGQR